MNRLATRIEVIHDGHGLRVHEAALEKLAQGSADSNVFYEPWMVFPAIESFPPRRLFAVLVWQADGTLIGFFPLELVRLRAGIARLQTWRHDYCFLSTPLVASRSSRESVEAILDWIASGDAPARLLHLEGVAADSEFAHLLEQVLRTRKGWSRISSTYPRAMYRPSDGAQPGNSNKHSKEMRRQERRLSELGKLEYRAMGDDDSLPDWIDRFLLLEASGWKGQAGTALSSSASSEVFFRSVASEARIRGRLQILAMELEGVPIAMKINFLSGSGGFAFKIAFDEHYRGFSPGVLLELFNMRHLVGACPQVTWMDSCARADHPMIDRLWKNRRSIASFSLAYGLVARAYLANKRARLAMNAILRRSL